MPADPKIAVNLRGVSFSYPQDDETTSGPLYTDFGLSIGAGEITAIMGASGSGKSTLGKLLGGELEPDNGTITWAEELADEPDHYYIDQDPKKVFYPYRTVRSNVAYQVNRPGRRAAESDRPAATEQLLADFRLQSIADRFPLFTSGGQQARLALARVLAWKPKGIVLDEYLGSLDAHTRDIVIANLHRRITEERMTIILITHHLGEVLKLADRCIILGNQPVKVVSDIRLDLPHPRDESTPGYRAAENALIDALRHGLL